MGVLYWKCRSWLFESRNSFFSIYHSKCHSPSNTTLYVRSLISSGRVYLRCTMLGSTTPCGLAHVGVSRSQRIRLLLDSNPRISSLPELEVVLSAARTKICPVRRLLGPSTSFRGPALRFRLGAFPPLYYSLFRSSITLFITPHIPDTCVVSAQGD